MVSSQVFQMCPQNTRSCQKNAEELHAATVWCKMHEYDQTTEYLSREMEKRQEKQCEEYTARMKTEIEPRMPCWSSETLRLRKIHKMLTQQRRFVEARIYRERLQLLEKADTKAWERKRELVIAEVERCFRQKSKEKLDDWKTQMDVDRQKMHSTISQDRGIYVNSVKKQLIETLLAC